MVENIAGSTPTQKDDFTNGNVDEYEDDGLRI